MTWVEIHGQKSTERGPDRVPPASQAKVLTAGVGMSLWDVSLKAHLCPDGEWKHVGNLRKFQRMQK